MTGDTNQQNELAVGHARRAPWKCNHMHVNFLNRERPAPVEIRFHCECGANWGCPVCGWGAGQHPCRCSRERMEALRGR